MRPIKAVRDFLPQFPGVRDENPRFSMLQKKNTPGNSHFAEDLFLKETVRSEPDSGDGKNAASGVVAFSAQIPCHSDNHRSNNRGCSQHIPDSHREILFPELENIALRFQERNLVFRETRFV